MSTSFNRLIDTNQAPQAVRQGGYVLAHAANSTALYEHAVEGFIALLTSSVRA
ncbi:hypothetical protein PQQ51_03730 [Paraburkholderia xenovorans]|uniref:hypothetical protein n=1 Tax=Paraburkholderia xenovorans TaxID=36873 RepID=UPI0038BBA297